MELSNDDVEKINKAALEISEMCLLPSANIDVTKINLATDYKNEFEKFRLSINHNLPILFDIFHKNENILLEPIKQTQQFRIYFVMILCEQSSSCELFKTENDILIKNIDNLINNYFFKYFLCDDHFLYIIFSIYKQKLNKDMWKENIGCLYGFLRFCEILYKEAAVEYDESPRYTDRCMFLLALGTNLSEHYDTIYKTIGIKLFNILLNKMNSKTIEQINIHEVIYSTAFLNIEKVTEEELNVLLWDCLYNCMKYMTIKDITKWNKLDDLFAGITKKILFESNLDLQLKLFYFLNRLSAICVENSQLINNITNFNYIEEKILNNEYYFDNEIRNICKKYKSFVTYRWVKRFLSLIITKSSELLYRDQKSVLMFLHAIHVTYLLVIFSIPPELIENQLDEFFVKFCNTAKACLLENKKDPEIRKALNKFFETTTIHRLNKSTENHDKNQTLLNLLQEKLNEK